MPQNGQVVRNKATGEMGVFQNGQVMPMDAGPISSGVNPAHEIAARNSAITARNSARGDAQFDYQVQRDRVEDARLAAEEAKAAEASRRSDEGALFNLMGVIRKLNEVALDANDNQMFPGLGETGTLGRIKRTSPFNNPAKDLSSNIDTLRANFAFDALQAMRDASRTGGALGAITERELDLLERAVTNIDPNQSHEQFLTNLQQARQAYLAKLAMLEPQLATRLGYDPEAAERAMISLNDAYNAEFGGASPLDIQREGPAAPTRTPQDIEAIMRKYGVQ